MKKFVVEVETLGRRQTRLVPARNENEARRNCTTAESKVTRNTVEEIREDITRRFPAMLPFARSKEDHKSVVESWI